MNSIDQRFLLIHIGMFLIIILIATLHIETEAPVVNFEKHPNVAKLQHSNPLEQIELSEYLDQKFQEHIDNNIKSED